MDIQEVDYQQVAAALQSENERLRMRILKMCNAHNPLELIRPGSIREFLIRNYIVIASISCLFLIVASLANTVKGLFKHS